MADDVHPPQAGDTFILSDRDYRYGSGPIVARIKNVVSLVEYDNEPWWRIEADAANGTPQSHGGWHCRELYIRQSSFPQTRQRF